MQRNTINASEPALGRAHQCSWQRCTSWRAAAPPAPRARRRLGLSEAAAAARSASSSSAAAARSASSSAAAAWSTAARRTAAASSAADGTAATAAAAAAAAAGSPAAATGRIFRATCPLEGWQPVEQALGRLYPDALALHALVVVEVLSSSSSEHAGSGGGAGGSGSSGAGRGAGLGVGEPSTVVAYDFLPANPTSPATAAILLSGGGVQGVTRSRRLSGLPRLRCEYVGATRLPDPHAAAEAFQRQWHGRQLQLLRRDCTHHTDALIAHLLQAPRGGE